MGKFSWTQGHSRQSSESKSSSVTSEWFAKSTGEPSRRALNDLVKENLAAEFGSDPVHTRTRSRSGTVSSVRSHYAKSSSDRSAEVKSRPQSRQSIMDDTPPSPTRHEPVSRSLFSKGSRLMRRKTSKLTLLPSQMEESTAESSRQDPDMSRLDLAAQLLNLSPKRSVHNKPNISGPFAFQHVTHTDQNQFQSLNKATTTEFVTEFSAFRAGQRPAQEIQGIVVDDLPSSSNVKFRQDAAAIPSPTSSIMPDLPTTPPRPAPPPKDEPVALVTTPNVRLSRSVENFSRPTRSPAFGADISPISEHPGDGDRFPSGSALPTAPPSPLSWAEATNDTLHTVTGHEQPPPATPLLDKPLPLPPSVVHAVSTADDSALPLRTSPLPTPPLASITAVEALADASRPLSGEQRPKSSHRASLRHMQTFPSAKSARRRSQSSGEMTLGPVIAGLGFVSPISPNRPRPARRTSIGIKKIDIDDWEDAIEYSWDHPLDLDDEFDMQQHLSNTAPLDQASFSGALPALPPPPTQRPPPLPLTPEMEQTAAERPTEMASPTAGHHARVSRYPSLQGLGIEAVRPATALPVDREGVGESNGARESLQIPSRRREPGSPISKSSSQESIILSIASSIMGTHRSSNSSTSLSDMDHLAIVEVDNAAAGPQGQQPRQGSIEGSASDSSQDTVTTGSHSALTPVTEFPSPPHAAPSAVVGKHQRGPSMSRVQVPNRTSSIVAGKFPLPPACRQRSNTLNGRPKNVRVSYSLFPNNTPQPPTPAS